MSKIIYAPPSPPPHHNTDVSVFPSLQPPTPAPAPPLAPPTSCAVTHEVSRTHAPFRTGVWRHGVKYNAHRRNDLRGGEGGGAGLAERGTGMIAKSCRSNSTEHTHQKKKPKRPRLSLFSLERFRTKRHTADVTSVASSTLAHERSRHRR